MNSRCDSGWRSIFAIILTLSILIPVVTICSVSASDNLYGMQARNDHYLVIGKVSEDPKKHYGNLKPIADYAVRHMGDLGVTESKVLFARDNRMMINFLNQGKVDWVTETPFSAMEFVNQTGAKILLRRWKKGVPEYRTVFFALKTSGIKSLTDLKGKTIAFEDPGSTSSFLLPSATLIQSGLQLVELATPREKPPAHMVGYVFSRNEVNAPAWVYRGFVDAAAFSNLDWEDRDRMLDSIRDQVEIFYQTPAVPRALELVRKNLSPQIAVRLKQVLLRADSDPKAAAALKAYKKTTRFDELGTDDMERIQHIESLSEIIKAKLR